MPFVLYLIVVMAVSFAGALLLGAMALTAAAHLVRRDLRKYRAARSAV